MEIHRLKLSEGTRWRSIRLAALLDSPDEFGTTFEEASARPLEIWTSQVDEFATFVAVLDAADVGVARGANSIEASGDAFLLSMWVAPTARAKGAGIALVNAVIDWAKSEGFSKILLDVGDDNEAASGLYTREGFKPTGETSGLPPPRRHIGQHRMELVFNDMQSVESTS